MSDNGARYCYDKGNDVLYILFKNNSSSYGEHLSNTVVIHRDLHSEDITSITLFDISKHLKDGVWRENAKENECTF